MKTFFAIIGFVVVALVVGTCVACNDDDDDRSLGGTPNVQAVSLAVPPRAATFVAYDERPRCYDDGYCDDDDNYQSGGDYSSRDRHRNERRNRGAFSPGPFDRSPVTIIICPPGTQYCGSDGGRNDQPPEESYV